MPKPLAPTAALYDDGEEDWSVKVHLGNGGIYLLGYANVDVCGVEVKDATEASDNWADISNYYERLNGSLAKLPTRRQTLSDKVGDFSTCYKEWGYQPGTIDKVVCIQMFEHLSPVEGRKFLHLLWGLMRPRAPLIISVPDMAGTLDLLKSENSAEREFAYRHIRGSGRDKYSFHQAWYNHSTLAELLIDCGFTPLFIENFHLYPAVCYRARA